MNNKCFFYTWLVGQIQNGDMFALYGGFPGSSVVKNLPAMQELQETTRPWAGAVGCRPFLAGNGQSAEGVLYTALNPCELACHYHEKY